MNIASAISFVSDQVIVQFSVISPSARSTDCSRRKMSGPKKWVSSRKMGRNSSKSSFSSNPSACSLASRTPPSPPLQLPPEEDANTSATSIVDFESGSTFMSMGNMSKVDDNPFGDSSLDSCSTGRTPSPSTTPPKKSWELGYKSFLKKSGKFKGPVRPLPPNHSSRAHRSLSSNAVNLPPKTSNSSAFLSKLINDDFDTSLADGFGDHSQHGRPHSAGGLSTTDGGRIPFSPSSPSKSREMSNRGGAFFKRMRSRTKSTDNFDVSMRKGHDRRNSPTNTPPGSAISVPASPAGKRPPLSPSHGAAALQEGLEKAALLNEMLSPPNLSSSSSTLKEHEKMLVPKVGQQSLLSHSHKDLQGKDGDLDQQRHRRQSASAAPPVAQTQQQSTSSSLALPSFERIKSMEANLGSNLVIPEGQPIISHNKQGQIEKERRKAFTDFHNTSKDSGSAYLGDESSLHNSCAFLSSMAYPSGSAGSKVRTRRSSQHSLAHSLDDKNDSNSPSTSVNAISEKGPEHKPSDVDFSPERALRSFKGPELWTKGERHAIMPGILSMVPIQVLNSMLSMEEPPSLRSSSPGSQRVSGIGSVISEDDGDSNGWFFADHHQPQAMGGSLPQHNNDRSSNLPSAFGKISLGKATVAPLGMRSFFNEIYGWCSGVYVLRQNYLFEYKEGDNVNGLPWGYAHLALAEAYPHKHFTNAFHLEFFERPCCKSGKRSLLFRVESKVERDRWVSHVQAASRMTINDLYDVDESDGAPQYGQGRYAVVLPAKRNDWRRLASISSARHLHAANSQSSFQNVSSYENLGVNKSSNPDMDKGAAVEYDCALKVIDKKEFWSSVKKGRERPDTLVREAAVQTTLAVKGGDTPGFVRLLNIFETEEKLVLELELLKGQDLFQHVSSRGTLSEVEAAHIMKDLLCCLDVLDQLGVAHRDIKPANLLMCHNEGVGGTKIKVADYGMASFVGVDNLVRGRCGTPGFVAPEILRMGVNGGYGNKVDMFSAGVTLYVMLSGYEPFYGESEAELIAANREAKVDFPHADWKSVSIEGRDLIERMLIVDPAKRISAIEALRHPWITRRAVQQRGNCN